ncbi:MAG: M14 family metallopeptidase [Balneolaceae bacterium]|nr:M14 family metallopeptidase [Balneolaceae bacterium]
MKTLNTLCTLLLTCAMLVVLAPDPAGAQTSSEGFFPAAGTPANPEVQASWNRYYNYQGYTELINQMAEAHPDLVQVQSIGQSYEGRDIWLVTVTNFNEGDPDRKPGMYIDGNIHSNEIQGTEMSLYTIWYLSEQFGNIEYITQLMNEKVFYIVPSINPDARENFFDEPNTASSPRSGMKPLDDDGDGRVDEDNLDDLNGDGSVTLMRRKNPRGEYRVDPDYPNRMVQVPDDQFGNYEILGREGIDNDGDGEVNEDRPGYYDPNRDWAWNWQPDYIQGGAHKYPFSLPENRAVADFVMEHPNIAAAQSYHNSGGMILRGPGAAEDVSTYNYQDIQVYDAIAEKGESFMPGYRYLVVYDDLYTVFGGELDWFYGSRGIFTYSNELWTSYLQFYSQDPPQPDDYVFNQSLLFGDAHVDWESYDHPTYGEIEIGGFKKNYGRAHPGFLLETDAHRNMAFTLYHTWNTPHLVIDEISTRDLGGGQREVTAVVTNTRLIPTHASHDVQNNIERPDYIRIEGVDVEAGMIVDDRDMNQTVEQKVNPQQLEVENIPGMDSVVVRWIVSGSGDFTVTVDSEKGGVASRSSDG